MKKHIFVIYAVITLLILSTSITLAQNQQKKMQINEQTWSPQHTMLEEIDQYQNITVEGQFLPVGRFPIPGYSYNIYSAQSFIPTLNTLTRVELYVGKNGTTTFPLTIAIRDNLSHTNLAEISIPPEQILTENFSWVNCDLPDTKLTTGTTYYIVGYTTNSTDNWYAWGGNYDRYSYLYGCAWLSLDEGGTWTNDSTNDHTTPRPKWLGTQPQVRTNESDMCFITYGYENHPPEAPEITGTLNGKAGIEYTYTFTVTEIDNDDIFLYVDWGDSCPAINWSGPYSSGTPIELSHTYENKGNYTIGAQAKDILEEEGPWGYLDISMPTAQYTQSLLIRTLQRILKLLN